jgi:hypothetical protein
VDAEATADQAGAGRDPHAPDRDGSFEPTARSTRDIEAHLRELYGVNAGRDLISRVASGRSRTALRTLESTVGERGLECKRAKTRIVHLLEGGEGLTSSAPITATCTAASLLPAT